MCSSWNASALQAVEAEFIAENGGGASVRLRKAKGAEGETDGGTRDRIPAICALF